MEDCILYHIIPCFSDTPACIRFASKRISEEFHRVARIDKIKEKTLRCWKERYTSAIVYLLYLLVLQNILSIWKNVVVTMSLNTIGKRTIEYRIKDVIFKSYFMLRDKRESITTWHPTILLCIETCRCILCLYYNLIGT